jgi:small subunit ribosomal protein S2
MATKVNIQSLIDAGVHFGHQTRRWNPKMKPYIFGARGSIYIIDLKQTLVGLDKAYSFVKNLAAKGGKLLFVGTKKQAQEAIQQNAERCNRPSVNHRWLGGMLTNFVTIRSRVTHMEEIEAMIADGRMAALPKKEQILQNKELAKLQANLNGVREMVAMPQALFVIDTMREEIAIKEARRLGIPVIGILDTNADPDEVEYGIPGNDDAIRSVRLMCELMADAVEAGIDQARISAEEMAAEKAKKEKAASDAKEAAQAEVAAEAEKPASKVTTVAELLAADKADDKAAEKADDKADGKADDKADEKAADKKDDKKDAAAEDKPAAEA